MSLIRLASTLCAAAMMVPSLRADEYTPFVAMNWSLYAELGSTQSFAFLPHMDGETGEVLRFAVSQANPFVHIFTTNPSALLIWSQPDLTMLADFAAAAPGWNNPPEIDFSTGMPEPYDPATAGLDGGPIPGWVDPGSVDSGLDPPFDPGTDPSPEALLATLPSAPSGGPGALSPELQPESVPEPGPIGLVLIGLSGFIAVSRRRKR